MMNKKASVTIFAMIGVLIVIAGGFIYYANTQSSREIVPASYLIGQDLSTEFAPIKNFVDDCIYKVSVEGLKLAGQQGGYITLLDPEINPTSIKIIRESTESEAVIFSPGSNLAVPYWYYLESENECRGSCNYDSKRPDLTETENSIEKQLERYIKKNLNNCLEDFNVFKDQGYQIDILGEIETDVIVAEKDISILVDYPIRASKDSSVKIEKYYANVPINLQKIYNLASEITNLQQEYRFFENAIINLIASFSNIDAEKLPPVTDMRFSYGSSLRWSKSNVQQQVTDILSSYIGVFQVDGTKNFEQTYFGDLLKQRLYDAFIIPVTDPQFSDLAVDFAYLDFWPIFFDLNCNGDVCEPESVSSPLLNLIGIQRYNFLYDISYPVLIEIKEPDALFGEGYNFKFFLEANVRNNEPLPLEFNPLEAIDVSERTLLCDYDQRQSGEVTLKILDIIEKRPVDDAKITYTVAGETCYIGNTNEEGTLKEKFPTGAAGGFVTVIKQDYLTKSKLFDANQYENRIELEIEPLAEKNIIIKKKNLVKQNNRWVFVDQPLILDQKERGIISLVRSSKIKEQEFSTAIDYSGSQQEPSKINLAPGEYHATINLMSYDDLVIPEKKVKKKSGLFGEDIEYTLPGMTFSEESPFMSGGLDLNISISSLELQNYDTIVFYVIGIDLKGIPENDRSLEDISQMASYYDYSNTYWLSLQPTFENR